MAFVSIEWLKRWCEVPAGLTAAQLAKDLVKVGLEEETIHTSGVTGPLVCGKVLRMEPETASNGKTVNYCRVDVGAEFNDAPGAGKEPSDVASRSIICGAHNFKEGDHVVVSLPGAVLPGDFRIATRKTYGHISDGMICSARELGLGEDHNGIIVLEEYLGERGLEVPPVGTDLLGMLGLNHELLEINITPDRGYCFSMRGVGREYSHSTGAAFTDWGLAENLKNPLAEANNSGFPVEITDDAPIRGNVGCDRFVTRMVRGFNPKAKTPEWMVTRLESAGMRSISLAVDVTNYVMLDLGQPMHAYDLDKVKGSIVVRRARDGEKHTTLDEVERSLYPEDLLVTDCKGGHAARVLGIAGVMGGAETEITAATTNVLLEAAHFDAVSVARAARRHKIPSESSRRFERGTDPQLPPVAAQYAAELLVEYGGGVIDEGITDVNHSAPMPSVTLGFDAASRLIGVEYSAERCEELLKAIGCQTCRDDSAKAFTVTPPSWRPDLVGAAHLVEEIARLDGFDQIPSLVPVGPAAIGLPAVLCTRREVSDTLAEAGLTEVMTYPFLGDEHDRQGFPVDDPRRVTVRLANPLADDAPALRTSVLDTLLNTASRNVARGNQRVAIYELDQVALAHGVVPAAIPGVEHRPSDEEMQALRAGMPKQPWRVAAVLAGNATEAYPGQPARAWDWADAIALAMRVATSQGLTVRPEAPNVKCSGNNGKATQSVAPFHPGRVAQIRVGAETGGKVLGYAGELHPQVCREFGLPERSCAFEIDLDAIEKARPKGAFQLRAVSTFPVAKEDFAFVVDTDVAALKVQNAIAKAAGDALESVHLFDSFTGEQLGQGKKSLAFALRLRAADHTLNPQDIREIRQRVIAKVQKTCRATLRA
ncbi:phenylalanine--tRNA ligase subunit beta [Mobiluncus mulieris]|uniref:Phenylalanine--tRNA ligase beta subunit n=1 Tax=Mobiluncus mulieris TaxID=2052 RepID=A0A7Y0UU43_9ACTO|nr:phenylalanine--tRNA ligase subunit beta [Mobiluncus mulieris]NMX03783.1 phenylalanine--tRNA ligase subunit beta [Mobiluncus mulieris]NMX11670.1 phenylalanine--tRNA ligase subunit beta [Mobiluncus mulieris]